MTRRTFSLALVSLAAGLSENPAGAQYTVLPACSQVQEDWKLVVANGDPTNDGPQVMTYLSPTASGSTGYAWFMINVRDNPNPYTPGGLQIQIWNRSDRLLGSSTSTQATAELSNTNETITWTQRIVISPQNNTSTFEVMNGKSTTWGDFGSNKDLAAVTLGGATDLSGYSPQTSVANSRAAWMPNNVTSLTLQTVRQYDADGKLLRTDNVNLSVNLTPQ